MKRPDFADWPEILSVGFLAYAVLAAVFGDYRTAAWLGLPGAAFALVAVIRRDHP